MANGIVEKLKKQIGETQQTAKTGDTEGPGVPSVPVEEPVPQATEPTSESGKDPYREMTIAQKLNRTDELLKRYEGTDKYDALKKRVDAMKHKYGVIAEVTPDAKWNYDEASQAVQRGLPDLQPNVQVTGSFVTPDYDSNITRRQNYLDWYSRRGWASRLVSKLAGQSKQLADTAENSRKDIAYFKGMKNALGYAIANPERAKALGTLITPRRGTGSDGSSKNLVPYVWNENTGRYEVIPTGVKTKPREPVQEVQSNKLGVQQASKAGDAPRRSDLSNFLATDEVPESLFGIPIVASPERYTQSDVEFFESHPRAGGFYELGDEDTEGN